MEPKQNVICPFCGKDIPPESRYCLFCGQDLAGQSDLQKADSFTDPDATIQFCKSCGVIIPPYSKYCPVCGERQRRSSSRAGQPPSSAPPFPSTDITPICPANAITSATSKFARSVAQVRDAGSHQSNNQQGDEHPQEVAEYGVEGEKYAYSPSGEKERAKDAKGYGHQNFGQDAKLLQIHR